MFDPENWPDWVHVVRLLFALLLTAGFGIHAYYRHKLEVVEAVSARTWMYWLYAMVFLLGSAANFTQLCVALAFHSYQKAYYHLGYLTLLLVLSYAAVLAGVRRRPY